MLKIGVRFCGIGYQPLDFFPNHGLVAHATIQFDQ